MGLLDFMGSSLDDPKTQATLAAVQGLLSGNKALPAISGGLLAYGGSMQQSKQIAAQEQMRQLQMQQQQMALAQAQRAAKQQEAQDAFRQSIPSPQFQAGLDVLAANGGVTQAGAANVPKVDPQMEMLYGAMKAGLIDPVQYIAQTKPQQAKIKEFREVRMPDGSVQIVGLDEYGKPVDTGRTPFKAEEVRDFGGFVGGIDPISGKARKIGNKTMTPGEVASNALGWANNAVSRDRLKLDQETAGGVTYQTDGTGQIVALPKRPSMAGNISAIPVQGQGSQGKKDANEALAIIGEAKKYLNDATGSGLGAATDATLGFFGKATEGSKATAQLQALSGALVAKMPKMSGPQSDKDVALYKQMAADIGNPWAPVEQRKAALDVVEGLQRKYAGIEPMNQPKPAAIPGLKFLGFEGQ